MAKADGLFVFIGAYSSEGDARTDYDAVKDLHAIGAVGNYDAAVVTKDLKGKVHVNKDETVTRKLAWGGAGVGALVGILFPPSILGSAAVLGAVGGVTGHLWKGVSRGDVKELGEMIDEGDAALVVIGELTVEEFVRDAVKGAKKQIAKELDVSTKDVDKELKKAAEELQQ
jgi:uncharacterized membrane protein